MVSIPNGPPTPFRPAEKLRVVTWLSKFQSPTGLPRHLDVIITIIQGNAFQFQSPTGLPRHLDAECSNYSRVDDWQFQSPTGLPRHLDSKEEKCAISKNQCFNPQRASHAI